VRKAIGAAILRALEIMINPNEILGPAYDTIAKAIMTL
jgi:hypothetical protein